MSSIKERSQRYSTLIVVFCIIVIVAVVYLNLPYLWIKRANKSIDNGDLETAAKMFTRVISYSTVNILGHVDDRAKGYYGRGKVYEKMGKYGSAVDDFDHFLELRSSPSDVYYHRGYSYLMLENYSMAALDFSRYLESDDNSFAAYYYRGYAHEMLDSTDKALENYLNACERGSPEGCNDYQRLLEEVED